MTGARKNVSWSLYLKYDWKCLVVEGISELNACPIKQKLLFNPLIICFSSVTTLFFITNLLVCSLCFSFAAFLQMLDVLQHLENVVERDMPIGGIWSSCLGLVKRGFGKRYLHVIKLCRVLMMTKSEDTKKPGRKRKEDRKKSANGNGHVLKPRTVSLGIAGTTSKLPVWAKFSQCSQLNRKQDFHFHHCPAMWYAFNQIWAETSAGLSCSWC